MEDSTIAENTTMAEHTVAIAEPSTSNYTTVMEHTAVVVQIASAVEVVDVPRAALAMVVALFDAILPSHSTCPFFCPRVDHMRENTYFHAQQTDKMCSINSLAS